MKLDIGCGPNKKDGFQGMDQYPMNGVDIVHDVRITPWPFENEAVEEVHCSHFLEHLTGPERVKFFNELYRVLKPGGKATIITPHWCSTRAYGDYTHQWPPVSEQFYWHLREEWRMSQSPHTDVKWDKNGHDCDFEHVLSFGLHPGMLTRNQEYVNHALSFYKEAAQDLYCTLTKR